MTTPATTSLLFLAEITVYDPSIASTRVLYFSSKPFTTAAGETPASQWYNPVLSQPVDVTRNLFTGGNTSGSSIVGLGDLVLLNPDGALDDLLLYGFDGQSLVIRATTVLAPSYPSDFTTMFSGTMVSAEFSDQTVTIKVRDLLAGLQLPFQTNKYGGTNVLPDGLDGVASDLQGKVKPVLLGKVGDGTGTGNFSPPCVNTSKLIYQVSDGAIASVDAVYDRGKPLNTNIQWNVIASPIPNTRPFSGGMSYGGGKFVMGDSTGDLYYSTDGITWSTVSLGVPDAGLALGWNGSSWLMLDTSGTYTSPDAITWTSHTAASFAADVWKVFWSSANSLWVVTGVGFIKTSPDGLTWTNRLTTTVICDGIAEGGGVTIVTAEGAIYSSYDCVTWTQRFADDTPRRIAFALHNGTIFCAVGFDISLSSVDGLTWTRNLDVPWSGGSASTLLYYNALFLTHDSGVPYLSADGLTWTLAPFPTRAVYAMRGAATDGTKIVSNGGHGTGSTYNEIAYTSPSPYASLADLEDDTKAPLPGGFISYPDGGYFRLGSSPVGKITCDATQGASDAARTAAQLFNTVLLRQDASASVNATDLTTLDGLNSAVLGIYVDSDTTFQAVIDQIAGTVGAGYWPSVSGEWRIKRIDAPSGSPVLSLGVNDIAQPLQVQNTTDAGGGLPAYRCTVNWGKNYTVQTTDLATGVTDDRRSVVAQEWRAAVSTDLTVQTAHPLSPALSKDSLFTNATDAQAEADRWQALMGVQRYRFLAVAKLTSETVSLDLGDEVELVNPRFALSQNGGDSGAQFVILDIQPSAKDETINITAWGAGQAARNIDTDDGLDWVTDDGVYVITNKPAD